MADSSPRGTERSAARARRIPDEATFDQLIRDNERVLVDFYADWCGPCQLMASTIDELATSSDANVVKVDVEELPQIATRYDIRSIPTFLAFEDGAVEQRLVGAQEKETLARTVR